MAEEESSISHLAKETMSVSDTSLVHWKRDAKKKESQCAFLLFPLCWVCLERKGELRSPWEKAWPVH